MNKTSLLLTFISLFLSCFLMAQSPDIILQNFTASHSIEKVYVSHDKPNYLTGESIWCKVFLVDGRTHHTINTPSIVYLDWIDPTGTIIQSYNIEINNGIGKLDIPIPKIATIGKYVLRAYTLYQKNFDSALIFQKEILISDFKIPKVVKENANDFSVDFFPEGGYIVAGLSNRIAFKAQDSNGNNIQLSGDIVDTRGTTITTFKTMHEGMGFFRLTPLSDQSYFAKVVHKEKEKHIELPAFLPTGYLLKANSRNEFALKLEIKSNTTSQLKACRLVGHARGQVFINQLLEADSVIKLSLSKEELPSGLLHFTLFDSQDHPVAERLVFNHNTKEHITTSITIKDSIFHFRALVEATISVQQMKDIVPSTISLSVYNQSLLQEQLQGLTIENYLLLQSELKGRIKNINQYFEKDNAQSRTLFDLLLLTHGWRRFTWQQVLAQQPLDLKYPKEKSFSLAGQIRKTGQKKPVSANVFLNILDDENYAFNHLTTGEDGLFYIEGLTLKDTTDLLIQANIYNEKKASKLKEGEFKRLGNKDVDIELFDLKEFKFDKSWNLPIADKKPTIIKQYIEQVASIQNENVIDESIMTVDIETVVVKEKKLSYDQIRRNKLKDMYKEKGLMHFGTTEKFFAEDFLKYDNFSNIFELIQTVIPGARRGGPFNDKIYTSPLGTVNYQGIANGTETGRLSLVLNGVKMSSDFIWEVKPESVFAMEYLAGYKADFLYQEPQVLVIITKNEEETRKALLDRQNIGMIQLVHPGFYQAKEFYSPSYSLKQPIDQPSDFRTTLYWNPDLHTTTEPTAFEFYTGDLAGEYLIWIEGLTKDGIPFTADKSFYVSENER